MLLKVEPTQLEKQVHDWLSITPPEILYTHKSCILTSKTIMHSLLTSMLRVLHVQQLLVNPNAHPRWCTDCCWPFPFAGSSNWTTTKQWVQ